MSPDGAVAVIAANGGLGDLLADGLEAGGVDVARVTADDCSSAAKVADAIAVSAGPGVRAVVDAADWWEPALGPELAALDADAWSRSAEEPLLRALHVLQGAHRVLRDSGGHIAVVLPSLATMGAPGAVATGAAAEGYRALTKAAARSWGRDGITVNCVLVPTGIAHGRRVERQGLQPPALDSSISVERDVAPLVRAVIGNAFAGVTGQTIAVDGGVWMTP